MIKEIAANKFTRILLSDNGMCFWVNVFIITFLDGVNLGNRLNEKKNRGIQIVFVGGKYITQLIA
jgi:hypothetical protein